VGVISRCHIHDRTRGAGGISGNPRGGDETLRIISSRANLITGSISEREKTSKIKKLGRCRARFEKVTH